MSRKQTPRKSTIARKEIHVTDIKVSPQPSACSSPLVGSFSVSLRRTRRGRDVLGRTLVRVVMPAFVLLTSTSALAFTQTETCIDYNDRHPFACRVGECPLPVSWPTGAASIAINEEGAGFADLEVVEAALEAGLRAWDEVDCADLELTLDPPTPTGVELDAENFDANTNVIVFVQQGWRWSTIAQAMTLVTYDPSTGVIVDADMEINEEDFPFAQFENGEIQTDRVDFQSILTHELGHFVGLDHAEYRPEDHVGELPLERSTMYGQALYGQDEKRSLEEDDIAAVCATYPLGQDEAIPRAEACACGFGLDRDDVAAGCEVWSDADLCRVHFVNEGSAPMSEACFALCDAYPDLEYCAFYVGALQACVDEAQDVICVQEPCAPDVEEVCLQLCERQGISSWLTADASGQDVQGQVTSLCVTLEDLCAEDESCQPNSPRTPDEGCSASASASTQSLWMGSWLMLALMGTGRRRRCS